MIVLLVKQIKFITKICTTGWFGISYKLTKFSFRHRIKQKQLCKSAPCIAGRLAGSSLKPRVLTDMVCKKVT